MKGVPMKECSFDKKYTDNAPVAMAYVPWQHFKMCENLEEGYQNGTIFPELVINHHFKWWFDFSPIRAILLLAYKAGVASTVTG